MLNKNVEIRERDVNELIIEEMKDDLDDFI